MIMAKKNVKTNLLDHSDAKVKLLGEYLKRYLNIISNDGYTKKIKIYDLFCGQGLYEDGGEGSPLVALRNIKDTYYSQIDKKPIREPKIDCYFNDIDQSKVSILEESIKSKKLHYPHIGNLELTSNPYISELSKLKETLKMGKNEKNFIFIDPYGYKDIKSEHIKWLMDSNKNSEVLLWLPTQHMYRFSDSGTPEALLEFIKELTNYKEWARNDSVWKFINQLKDGFQKYLGVEYFVDIFSIKKDENTVFCLYFFTSHIRGFEKMLEAKWKIDTENGRGWEFRGNNPTLFHEHKTNEFEEKLRKYLLLDKKYNYDIYEFTLRQGYLPKHTKEIFESWQNNGSLNVIKIDGQKARKGSFYIRYYKSKSLEQKKVYFKLI